MTGSKVLRNDEYPLKVAFAQVIHQHKKTIDTITFVHYRIRNDQRLSTKEVSGEVGISISICHWILSDELGLRRVPLIFMLQFTTEKQVESRIEVLELNHRGFNDPIFIKSFITVDEARAHRYDSKTTIKSSQ